MMSCIVTGNCIHCFQSLLKNRITETLHFIRHEWNLFHFSIQHFISKTGCLKLNSRNFIPYLLYTLNTLYLIYFILYILYTLYTLYNKYFILYILYNPNVVWTWWFLATKLLCKLIQGSILNFLEIHQWMIYNFFFSYSSFD